MSLTLTGTGFTSSSIVTLDGVALPTTWVSTSTLQATGYLVPWKVGSIVVGVTPAAGADDNAEVMVPIVPTPVTYDVASRFSWQTAFGPRPDVVARIQTLGLDAFITDQMAQPPIDYTPFGTNPGAREGFIASAVGGNSLLRQKVALALESYVENTCTAVQQSCLPWEQRMEIDAFGNYRQVILDAATNAAMGFFLNMDGNFASPDPTVHPNQNFAREVMQLFSIGDVLLNNDGSLQVDGAGNPLPTYSQDTVADLSRIFTGWTHPAPVNPVYTAFGIDFSEVMVAIDSLHDHGAKLLFGTVAVPAGQSAKQDLDMAVDAIFNHPNLPPFVSRILIQRLVKSAPSPAYIARIAKIFEDDGAGVRGNMAAIVRAILLDPEARAGDTSAIDDDGILQSPFLFELSTLSVLQIPPRDGQPQYLVDQLGEPFWNTPTVFGAFSPANLVPGTLYPSPEFGLFTNLTVILRSQYLWGMIKGTVFGIYGGRASYLYTHFTNIPDLVEALNHLLYHGSMPAQQQADIIAFCSHSTSPDPLDAFDQAIFLAMNGDNYNVAH